MKYKTKPLHSPERNIFISKASISFSSEYLQHGFYNLWMKNYSRKDISAINSFLFISKNITIDAWMDGWMDGWMGEWVGCT